MDDNGRVYYENMETGMVSRTMPASMAAAQGSSPIVAAASASELSPAANIPAAVYPWLPLLDEESGDWYYENELTGETTWEIPTPAGAATAVEVAAASARAAPPLSSRGGPIAASKTVAAEPILAYAAPAALVDSVPHSSRAVSSAVVAATPVEAVHAKAASVPTPAATAPVAVYPWLPLLDEESGDWYYENELTGETAWEIPASAGATATAVEVAAASARAAPPLSSRGGPIAASKSIAAEPVLAHAAPAAPVDSLTSTGTVTAAEGVAVSARGAAPLSSRGAPVSKSIAAEAVAVHSTPAPLVDSGRRTAA